MVIGEYSANLLPSANVCLFFHMSMSITGLLHRIFSLSSLFSHKSVES